MTSVQGLTIKADMDYDVSSALKVPSTVADFLCRMPTMSSRTLTSSSYPVVKESLMCSRTSLSL